MSKLIGNLFSTLLDTSKKEAEMAQRPIFVPYIPDSSGIFLLSRWMKKPRCGVPDHPHLSHRRRIKRYALTGQKWRQKHITYRYNPTCKQFSGVYTLNIMQSHQPWHWFIFLAQGETWLGILAGIVPIHLETNIFEYNFL